MLIESLTELQYPHHKDITCVTIEGPRFSTLAESQLYRSWGAHIVNMTAVPEAPLAAELGLIYASLSLVTDYDCWHSDAAEEVSVELVCSRMKVLASKARQVLAATLAKIAKHDWSKAIQKRQDTARSAIMFE
jgi:5'-methylthioadenosine phosphorylase